MPFKKYTTRLGIRVIWISRTKLYKMSPITCIISSSPRKAIALWIQFSSGSMEVLAAHHYWARSMNMDLSWLMMPLPWWCTINIPGIKRRVLFILKALLKSDFHTLITSLKTINGLMMLSLPWTEMQCWNFSRFGKNSNLSRHTLPEKAMLAFMFLLFSKSISFIKFKTSRLQCCQSQIWAN